MKFQIVLIVFISGIITGCTEHTAETRDTPPWEGLGYLSQINTSFSLVNHSPDSIYYSCMLNRDKNKLGTLEGKIAPKDSIIIRQKLFKPISGYLSINDTILSGPYLIPSMDRQLHWDGNKLFDTGRHAPAYGYIQILNNYYPIRGDESLLGLSLEEVHDHGINLFKAAIEQSETYPSKKQLPQWLLDFYHREAAIKSSESLESQRGYLAYAYADTLKLPTIVHNWIDRLLEDPHNQMMPSFNRLQRYHSYNEAPQPKNGVTHTNRNYRLDFENITDVKMKSRRDDLLADWTEYQLLSFSTYAIKDELISIAKKRLPKPYVKRLDYIRDSLQTKISNDDSALKLFSMPFSTESDTLTPLLHRKQAFTLYKFWFPGCRPCVSQYPFERKLLANHPNLELVNIAYSTRKDHWLEYIQKHDMPGSLHLYLPKQKRKAIQAAIGILGAPRYLLLGLEDKVICRNCPKPEDSLLDSLIRT